MPVYKDREKRVILYPHTLDADALREDWDQMTKHEAADPSKKAFSTTGCLVAVTTIVGSWAFVVWLFYKLWRFFA